MEYVLFIVGSIAVLFLFCFFISLLDMGKAGVSDFFEMLRHPFRLPDR
ncbi:MAG: hypothetical protein IT280_06155 [Ignavibacteria bacterium]|nr:hypothetical protein [Ignavibacteria bacterium]